MRGDSDFDRMEFSRRPAKRLRPAVEAQLRRWLAEWAIPEGAQEWLVEVLEPSAGKRRGERRR